MKEKRVFKRVKIKSVADKRVKIKSVADVARLKDKTRFKVFAGDISCGGMELFSEKEFKIGDRLEIKLSLLTGSGKTKTETLTGEVRWATPFNKATIGGVEFHEVITQENHSEIYSYIMGSQGYLK